MICALLLAASLLTLEKNGIEFRVDGGPETIDPARSVFLTVTASYPRDVKVVMPDFRERVRGFSLAEDFAEPPRTTKDGRTVETVNWKLVPEPYAEEYKIAPFLVKASPRLLSSRLDDGSLSFVAGPLRFSNPPPPGPVTGGIETDPKKDLPPFSWRLAGFVLLAVAAACLAVLALLLGLRYLARRVKEHRMSPIERAWAELDRLLKKGLPGRGRYKDFYVELTMVVRRYVQRQHGVAASHMTTEEFFDATRNSPTFPKSTLDELIDFLRKADIVKFAGVKATLERASEAIVSARTYIVKDNEIVMRREAQARRLK